MSVQPKVHVLLVEDSPTDAMLTETFLPPARFQVRHASRLSEALQLLGPNGFNVVLLDLGLPDSQGLETLRALRARQPFIAIVVLTGHDDEELAIEALQNGAQDYLVKGRVHNDVLGRSIRYAIERRNLEQSIRQGEDRVRELTEHIEQVLWMMDAKESKVLYVSAGYEKMWGRSCQTLIENPQSFMEGIHPLDLDLMLQKNEVMFRTGHIDAECRVLRPDQSVRWIWVRGYPILKNGDPVRIVGVIEDITERRILEEERHTLLSQLQLYVQRVPLAYALFNHDLRIVEWNPAAERIFGYPREAALGLHPFDLISPAFRPEAAQLLDGIRSGDMNVFSTNENVTKDGRKIVCEWVNTPLHAEDGSFAGLLSLGRDVTERRLLEQQFQQAQKMEAVGQLAGGVAHDFNNLLTIINGCSELIQMQLPEGNAERELAHEIGLAGERAAGLTRQLLAFSRKQVLETRVLNLNEIVVDAGRMLKRLIGEDISVSSALNPALHLVKVDAGQIEQVLMNLAVNARDAMPQGGKLTIETANVEFTQTTVPAHTDLKPGRYVMLAMTDTGTGMDAATRTKIFEPFFTTKGVGKGSGLGLATVFGIVKQSLGHIAVYSEPRLGTSFKIYLPAIEAPASARKQAGSKSGVSHRGTETILLAEDEPALRSLVRHILTRQGYRVLDVEDGEHAIQLVESLKEPIHLLVTDVVMPGMSGRLLGERLAQKQPGIKILYLSGYTDDAIVRHGILAAETAFLQKPFSPAALAAKVREILDANGSRS
jgi:two-component system cell cycle sensor histidine kinase/response regulator CckA